MLDFMLHVSVITHHMVLGKALSGCHNVSARVVARELAVGSLNQQRNTRNGRCTFYFHLLGHRAGQEKDTLRMNKLAGVYFLRGPVSQENQNQNPCLTCS